MRVKEIRNGSDLCSREADKHPSGQVPVCPKPHLERRLRLRFLALGLKGPKGMELETTCALGGHPVALDLGPCARQASRTAPLTLGSDRGSGPIPSLAPGLRFSFAADSGLDVVEGGKGDEAGDVVFDDEVGPVPSVVAGITST